jgi:serine/threonine protein kinase
VSSDTDTTLHDSNPVDAAFSIPADPFPGELRLLERLGGGGFGVVYKALDLSPLGRLVALKFLSPRASLARTLPALRTEARLLASVRHPNIVGVHAWKTTSTGLPCLVLEYIAGGSLEALLGREGPLPWPRATRFIADIAAGLALLHERGIIHRDVKPDNMLLDTERGEALLTDLGIAARLDEGAPSAGTIPYMSPEAFDGHVSPAVDVYALSASLFQLLTGEVPFVGQDVPSLIAAILDGLPDPDPRLGHVPAPLARLLRQGLAASLTDRPGLAELSVRLRASLNSLLADALAVAGSGLQLRIFRRLGGDYRLVASASQPGTGALRDLRMVPGAPSRARMFTGERARIEVEATQPGSVTVLNIGPTGNLNLLSPPVPVRAGEARVVAEAELRPPSGSERILAIWTEPPHALPLERLRALVERAGTPAAGAYGATRDMDRMREVLAALPEGSRAAAVLELEHLTDLEPEDSR